MTFALLLHVLGTRFGPHILREREISQTRLLSCTLTSGAPRTHLWRFVIVGRRLYGMNGTEWNVFYLLDIQWTEWNATEREIDEMPSIKILLIHHRRLSYHIRYSYMKGARYRV